MIVKVELSPAHDVYYTSIKFRRAAVEGPSPKAIGVVIKSVCDFADETKTDSVQAYAAFTSCQVLARFAGDYL
jgi:hypothetical protein